VEHNRRTDQSTTVYNTTIQNSLEEPHDSNNIKSTYTEWGKSPFTLQPTREIHSFK